MAARRTTVVDGALKGLKALLKRRGYRAGTRLPGERSLARDLGVSRPSLREALRTLERLGVVTTRHGSGTVVADSGADVLRAPLEFLFMLDKPSVRDLHETRRLLEVHLAAGAAEHRTDADLAELDAALADMDAARDTAAHTRADVRFHQAIASASGNRVLARLMNCLREPMSAMIDAAWPASPHLGNSRPSHQAIADAVRAGDAAASRRAMQDHLDEMTQELRKVKLLP